MKKLLFLINSIILILIYFPFIQCKRKDDLIQENLDHDTKEGVLFSSKYLDVIDNEIENLSYHYKNKDKKFYLIKVKNNTDLEYLSFILEEYFITNGDMCDIFMMNKNKIVLITSDRVMIKSKSIIDLFPHYIDQIDEYKS